MSAKLVSINTIGYYYESPKESYGFSSYFDIKITGSDQFSSTSWLDGWCLNDNIHINGTLSTYQANLYSSLDPELPLDLLLEPDNLDLVNWVLNQDFAAKATYTVNGSTFSFNYGEVQSAVWNLMGLPIRTSGADLTGQGTVDSTDVSAILSLASANGEGFVPSTSQYSTYIIDPYSGTTHYQPLIVVTRPASIGNYVWLDVDKDGVQDAGEVGVNGVTVELYDGADNLISTTTTGDDYSTAAVEQGYYQFTGLKPGSYQVKFIAPSDKELTVADSSIATDATDSDANQTTGLSQVVTLAAGESNQTIDAGLVERTQQNSTPASLSGFVYQDEGNDGAWDGVAAGIENVVVTLTGIDDSGAITPISVQTDINGYYSFDGLHPGTYTVTESQPLGYLDGKDTADEFSSGNAGNDIITGIALTAGQNSPNNNFGELVAASLGNRLWTDSNANGQQDAGEAGIVGATVILIGGGADGKIGTADDNTKVTTTTGTDGIYNFTGLTPGVEYQVQFAAPTGSVFTGQNLGSDDGKDSDVDASTGKTQIVTLTSGENNLTLDAGVYAAASLGDRLWTDSNANGQQDVSESGIVDATVTLIGGGVDGLIGTADDNTKVTTTTGTDGIYNFTGLTPGVEYQVQFAAPTGSVFTGQNLGSDDGKDSDVDASTGKTQIVTLTSGENNLTLDAGVYAAASLGDRLWTDSNANGQQDVSESGIVDATVTLIGGGVDGLIGTADDNTKVTTTTGTDGIYNFTGLTPGVEYQVQFAAPTGSVFTGQNLGSDDGKDSDVDASTGKTQIVTLTSGENNLTLDAGVYAAASLGDRLWTDSNANGQQDDGETGISGATVTLIGGGVDGLIGTADDNTKVTTTTGTDGIYNFTGLTPGVEYQVQFAAPTGSVFTGQNLGSDDGKDSDVDASTGKTQIVTLTSGENNLTLDAGIYAAASLGDRLWTDSNANGQQDVSESGIVDATVTLIGGGVDGLIGTADDNTKVTTTTGTDGIYNFTGLTPGVEYQVQFAAPTGSVFTGQNLGSDDGKDSDVDASTGKTQIVTLTSGENNLTLDAGVYAAASLGDRLWTDSNANGQQDVSESGIVDATVTLIGGGVDGLIGTADDNTKVTTTTGTDGIYNFTGLTPGVEYQVQFAAPTGSVFTGQNLGSDDGKDSDVDASTGKTQIVTLTSGENNVTLDAGVTVLPVANVGVNIEKYVRGSYETTTSGGGTEGFSPGFWKNHACSADLKDWEATGYTKNDSVADVFGIDACGTLLDALSAVGGGVNALLRQSVAGLLNASNPNIDYEYTVAEVIQMTQTAVSTGNYSATQSLLETENSQEGDWDTPATGGSSTTVETPNDDADNAPGISLNIGDTAIYTYEVKNTGEVALNNVQVTDDKIATLTFVDGDVDNDGQLDLTETWTYTARETVTTTGLRTNTGTVAATAEGKTVTDSDDANYTVAAPPPVNNASIGNKVWLDKDGDGKQDSGEAGVAGVTVTLISGGTTLKTTTTDASGLYSFTDLAAGEYQVDFEAGSGYALTRQNAGSDDAIDSDADRTTGLSQVVTLKAGATNNTIDAGLTATCPPPPPPVNNASIGDKVWLDKDGDGKQESGEAGVAGVTVTLISGGTTLKTTTTDANGIYSFTDLAAGEYQVDFEAGSGYALTRQNAGSDDAKDSDADRTTGLSQVVTLKAGATNNTIDAGLTATCPPPPPPVNNASIGDKVWLDKDGDGKQDSGEAGVAGVTVTLISGGTTLKTTTTDANGIYSFTDLAAGEYQIDFETGSGYALTRQNAGSDDAKDSDANRTTGLSQVVNLKAGATNNTIDAGLTATCPPPANNASVGDKVWDDMNHNNIQDSSEPGIANIRIMLTGAGVDGNFGTADDVTQNTTTDENGKYLFKNLAAGDYQLTFDKENVSHWNYNRLNNMSDWKWAVKDAYSNSKDTLDSDVAGDAKATTDITTTSVFTLAAGQNDMTKDAGITPIVIDLNGDGIHTIARTASTATFDLFGNGTPITSGWLSADDGFLAVDSNHNGKIDGISELFGGLKKGDGFAKLSSFDSTGNGIVDAADVDFSSLSIWRDINGNHATDDGELFSLAAVGVTSLKTSFDEKAFIDVQGNLLLERSSATFADGHLVEMTDVYFNVLAADAAAADIELIGLGDLAG